MLELENERFMMDECFDVEALGTVVVSFTTMVNRFPADARGSLDGEIVAVEGEVMDGDHPVPDRATIARWYGVAPDALDALLIERVRVALSEDDDDRMCW